MSRERLKRLIEAKLANFEADFLVLNEEGRHQARFAQRKAFDLSRRRCEDDAMNPDKLAIVEAAHTATNALNNLMFVCAEKGSGNYQDPAVQGEIKIFIDALTPFRQYVVNMVVDGKPSASAPLDVFVDGD